MSNRSVCAVDTFRSENKAKKVKRWMEQEEKGKVQGRAGGRGTYLTIPLLKSTERERVEMHARMESLGSVQWGAQPIQS